MDSKVVVITGASGGIGEALAKQLAAQGHKLVLAARRQGALDRVAQACGPNAVAVATDVTKRADVEALRDAALQAFGHIDVWVNNAGQGITRSVLALRDADIDLMMAVNVKSALYGMQAVVPHFQARGTGTLINVSSFLARIPMATPRSIYSASKAALNSLTANLRVELKQSHPGIAVCLVMPGIVETEFFANTTGDAPLPPPPGAPTQTPQEVAALMASLLENPVAELYTQPGQREMAVRYVQDVAAFEAQFARR